MEQASLFGTRATANGHAAVVFTPDFAGWQAAARAQWQAGMAPDALWWQPDRHASPPPVSAGGVEPRVPRQFMTLARAAACYRSADRWTLLYRLLWRLTHGERHLLRLVGDPDVARVDRYAKAVKRDVHKMKAFVRFRILAEPGFEEPRYVAWFEPEHEVVEYAAGFFQRRFANMRWSILTPDRCAHWEGGGDIWFSPGADRTAAPDGDVTEDAWRVYYRSIFNPARVKIRAMMSEMPAKYWKNLPEAALIPGLIAGADRDVAAMTAARRERDDLRCGPTPASPGARLARQTEAAAPGSLEQLALRAAGCRRCGLCGPATQTVFGEGPEHARIMLVGEQPGDAEDLAGRPFVGPAGRLLDAALADAGLDRRSLYVTNAVKHFKFTPLGKTRVHAKPDDDQVRACRPWLEAEIARVRPEIVVALGATAAMSLLERPVSVTRYRGRRIDWRGRCLGMTVHPAFVLRAAERRTLEYRRFVSDLAAVAGGRDTNH
ncbi:UdgX family uracil-DNA binding protein [Salinisphaera sp.]|uniref:UdgX family uracil-DNA binding protein n=1 Tax=Salinisphaera sp. TaxID=1914330 RepID=UPI002D77F088|nr:UdgX family uracil-DNA binding protein [Salinisphaera sp.]HET7313921.1 UdgX family uracil-DNA binding protein [Salinisphaera sp.]